jgi:hypothetical protein
MDLRHRGVRVIQLSEGKYFWSLGYRPDDHLTLMNLNLKALRICPLALWHLGTLPLGTRQSPVASWQPTPSALYLVLEGF